MDVIAKQKDSLSTVDEIVKLFCDDLQVSVLNLLEYRGQAVMFEQVIPLIDKYPHYTFTHGYTMDRYIFTLTEDR